ncbi:MAG: NUDIX hydrolase [Gammaproteobacteria bacterium]|nr:NUDIX hydrolase [Gammaproteobacteria bacterium]NND48035.1 NUDIX hydrolase [Woeseiaceae bacterium]
MQPTDLTVAAVVEHEGRFLLVEEYASGRRVFSQPGGHIEAGESPEQAVIRETREETACDIACGELVGVYLWIHPQTRQQFLRIVFAARFLNCNKDSRLDDGIIGRHWFTLEEIASRQASLRSPAVLRCVNDYVAGERQSDALLTGMLPLQQNVDRVIATAALV